MGLFDRLFGKKDKDQDSNLSEELERQSQAESDTSEQLSELETEKSKESDSLIKQSELMTDCFTVSPIDTEGSSKTESHLDNYSDDSSSTEYLAETESSDNTSESHLEDYSDDSSSTEYLAETENSEYTSESHLDDYSVDSSSTEYLAETESSKHTSESLLEDYAVNSSSTEYLTEIESSEYTSESLLEDYSVNSSSTEYLTETEIPSNSGTLSHTESETLVTSSYSVMEEYYKRKAEYEQKIADGTYVAPHAYNENEPQISDGPETKEAKYDRSLKKTRTGFAARLNSFFATFRTVDEEFFEELEEMLILSDVGVSVASQLTEDLRQEAKLENAKKPEDLRRVIIEKLVNIYEKDGVYNERINYQDDLTVMLFVGVNGVGKTTSIGKLAYRYKNEGKKVMLVAADTFRAGAVAQLAEWGRRVDVPVVMGQEKADPASVVFDGVERAVAEGIDILLIDTAGRLQNKENLMAELEKMGRIIKRVVPDAPHETLLALDASTGQNALSQAKEFSKIMPLTGLILTKIDGTAKGGVVLAIRQELDIPVKFIGFGEKIDDIGEFNSVDFMRGLLGDII